MYDRCAPTTANRFLFGVAKLYLHAVTKSGNPSSSSLRNIRVHTDRNDHIELAVEAILEYTYILCGIEDISY